MARLARACCSPTATSTTTSSPRPSRSIPKRRSAAAQFATGTKNAKACDGQRALSTGGDAAWKFTVPEINADTVRWSKQQIGIPFDWTCYAEARLRNNAIVQAMACQGDDGGQVTVTTMTDRMSASVWELSGR